MDDPTFFGDLFGRYQSWRGRRKDEKMNQGSNPMIDNRGRLSSSSYFNPIDESNLLSPEEVRSEYIERMKFSDEDLQTGMFDEEIDSYVARYPYMQEKGYTEEMYVYNPEIQKEVDDWVKGGGSLDEEPNKWSKMATLFGSMPTMGLPLDSKLTRTGFLYGSGKKGLGTLSAISSGLTGARNFLQGFGDAKMREQVMDQYRADMKRTQYSPIGQSQQGTTGDTGQAAYGGMFYKGGLKEIPEDNKGLPLLSPKVREQMGYMGEGGTSMYPHGGPHDGRTPLVVAGPGNVWGRRWSTPEMQEQYMTSDYGGKRSGGIVYYDPDENFALSYKSDNPNIGARFSSGQTIVMENQQIDDSTKIVNRFGLNPDTTKISNSAKEIQDLKMNSRTIVPIKNLKKQWDAGNKTYHFKVAKSKLDATGRLSDGGLYTNEYGKLFADGGCYDCGGTHKYPGGGMPNDMNMMGGMMGADMKSDPRFQPGQYIEFEYGGKVHKGVIDSFDGESLTLK